MLDMLIQRDDAFLATMKRDASQRRDILDYLDANKANQHALHSALLIRTALAKEMQQQTQLLVEAGKEQPCHSNDNEVHSDDTFRQCCGEWECVGRCLPKKSKACSSSPVAVGK